MALTPFWGTSGAGGGLRGGTVWDPFRAWDPLVDNTAWGTLADWPSTGLGQDLGRNIVTNVDWRETDKEHILKVDLPGLSKDAVQVQVEEPRVLRISGEFSKEETQESDTWHRVERRSGQFLRRFRMPDNANMDQIKAQMDHGVLTVSMPKTQQQEPQRRAIDIA